MSWGRVWGNKMRDTGLEVTESPRLPGSYIKIIASMVMVCFCRVSLLEAGKTFKPVSCLFLINLDRKYYKAENKGAGRQFQNELFQPA